MCGVRLCSTSIETRSGLALHPPPRSVLLMAHLFKYPPAVECPLHWPGSEWWDPGKHSPCCCCCLVSPTHSSPCEGPAAHYSSCGVCVGLPPIHRSSFTFWETWGWVSNWHQAFSVSEYPAQHPTDLALCCLCIPQPGPIQHSFGDAKAGQQCGM